MEERSLIPCLMLWTVHQWWPTWESVSKRWGLRLWGHRVMASGSVVLEIIDGLWLARRQFQCWPFDVKVCRFLPPHSYLPRGCCWVCRCWACCAQFCLPSSNWNRCQLEKWIETGNTTWVIELFWWAPSLIQSYLAATATALSLHTGLGLSYNRVPPCSRDCS